jgi:hypothetical protein
MNMKILDIAIIVHPNGTESIFAQVFPEYPEPVTALDRPTWREVEKIDSRDSRANVIRDEANKHPRIPSIR